VRVAPPGAPAPGLFGRVVGPTTPPHGAIEGPVPGPRFVIYEGTKGMQALAFYRTAVGKKVIMALSGLFLVGWLTAHLTGNLLVFRGAETMNGYAKVLHSQVPLLWSVRFLLIGAVVAHVTAATQLTLQARRSRPVSYAKRDPQISTLASRTIRWGGALILVFLVYHLLHFTTGTVHPDFQEDDVFANIQSGLSRPLVALFYLSAMAAIGAHFYHGLWSSIRSLGLAPPAANPFRRRLAAGFALLVWLGFTSIPIAALIGKLL
jgi:succinate dehydrogenase / fumarate reductase, cytochrome b subunit